MTEELDRARFEAWVEDRIRGGMKGWSLERNDFDYEHPVVFSMWQGWKAATCEEVERLRKELADTREAIAINSASAKAECGLELWLESCGTIHIAIRLLRKKLDKADKDIETWRNNFQMLSVKASGMGASEKAAKDAYHDQVLVLENTLKMAESDEKELIKLRASETAMREALNRMLVAFVGNDDELCMECGEKQGTGSTCETCYVIGKAVEALAAAQANTKEQQ